MFINPIRLLEEMNVSSHLLIPLSLCCLLIGLLFCIRTLNYWIPLICCALIISLVIAKCFDGIFSSLYLLIVSSIKLFIFNYNVCVEIHNTTLSFQTKYRFQCQHKQALQFLQQFIENNTKFDKSVKKILNIIAEVELVSIGYKLYQMTLSSSFYFYTLFSFSFCL
jgi:hypothetical protein